MEHIEIEAHSRGYRITDDGKLIRGDKALRPKLSKIGYFVFEIIFESKRHYCYCHRLQAYQKFGNDIYEKATVVRHLNGDKRDNSSANISIGTRRDNLLDIPQEQRVESRKRAIKTLLNNGRVIDVSTRTKISAERKKGTAYSKISEMYNLPISTIRYICKNPLFGSEN